MSDDLGLSNGRQDLIVLHDGRTMTTHGAARCMGPFCCIHNPSDHPLKDAPLSWMDEMNMMFRVCEHDHIHPDPDSLQFHQMMAAVGRAVPYDGYHPCCEKHCCSPTVVDE